MTSRHIFHLSIAVADLAAAKHFYVEVLGAAIGREYGEWLDILLWGHQITLHEAPGEVVPLSQQGRRHFGVTLPWGEWERNVQRIRSLGVEFVSKPAVSLKGTPRECAKFFLSDPGNNVIEMKAYRNVANTLGLEL